MNNEIKVYGFASFDRSAKVHWLLTEMGQKHDMVYLNREKKENEGPEYLKINPTGRVPTVKIDDISFYESGAICTYLADHFGQGKFAPALDSPQRGKYLQWMFFASAMLDTLQSRIMVVEDIPEGPLREKKESALVSDLKDCMEALDQDLQQGDYLVGGKFSAADVCVGYHLYFLTLWPELNVVIQDFPKVTGYLERLKARSVVKETKALEYE